jgi:hypothetical protein
MARRTIGRATFASCFGKSYGSFRSDSGRPGRKINRVRKEVKIYRFSPCFTAIRINNSVKTK